MGTIADGLIRRLRTRLDRWSSSVPETPSPPTPEQIHRSVADAERGRADDLPALLLAVSSGGNADLNAHTARALLSARPRTWLALDAAARRIRWYEPRWTNTVIRRLLATPGPLDLLLAACHPDGFVREAAVAAISERDDTVALPVLALRAADWVPAVRDRTRQACRHRFDRAPADAVTHLAPVAFALRARQSGGWLAEAIEALLRDGPPRALTTALASPDRITRRTAHRIALAANRLDVDQLVRAARTDSDLPIRIMCAEAAIRRGNGDVPRRLLASGTAAVRAEAVRVLGTNGAVDPAIDALVDRSALVRATAQAIVHRAGTDPAAHYRVLLSENPTPSAIAGLGETGSSADADLLRPQLAHPSSRGRAEAVRALRRLGRTSPDMLLPLLTDPVSSVARQVVISLLPQAGTLDEQALRPRLHPRNPRHVRRAVGRLLRAHGTWTRIDVDLLLIDDPAQEVRADARADLANWLARDAATTYAFPCGPRAAELSALLTAVEAVLGPEQSRLLRFHLGF
ncbi:hypothetical protein ABT337_02925 [Saccharopolyspora hirsuta]|uniref:HEAT repeat domain-containing protein n=1 Tax=Saccharopolyspora hirsuta TaxID=1837 RepID=A0A5M7BPA6_SACHI|nr:hypothetical protein [Saccharopolyspora hirsuta]KAA5832066.1 hypothetical protein F1721_19910 [Saccharopolyspora hirsuta]